MGDKIYILRFREVNKDTFEAVKKWTKRVETRAATKKYIEIKTGDILQFVCGKDKFEKKVKKAKIFKSITSMLRKYRIKDINPFLKTKAELREKYYSFPGYEEKIKKHGLIAFEL